MRITAGVALTLLLAACGTRISHDDVVRAAGASRAADTGAEATSTGALTGDDATAAGVEGSSSGGATDGGSGAASTGSGTQRASAGAAAGRAQSGASASTGGAAAIGAKSPVKIALVGTLSGPAGVSLGPLAQGVQTWVRFINDTKGGVNGHPVRLSAVDDGSDPARHRAQVQEQVEKQKVVAFVGNTEALTGKSSVEYITSKRIPVIGSDTANQYFYESPMYFPQASHGDSLLVVSVGGTGDRAKAAGKKKWGVISCQEVQVCRDLYDRGYELARRFGMEPVYRAQTSLAQPDFTAECLAARNAGVEIFQISLDSNSVARLASSCARQNYRPIFAWGAAIQVDRQKTDPNLDGAGVNSNVFAYFQGNTPQTAEWQSAIKRYAPTAYGVGAATGWVAAKLFEKAAANMPEPPTAEAVLEGLWSVKNDTLGGLTQPLTFVKNQRAKPLACWYDLTLRTRQWITPDNFKLHCA